MDRIIATGNLRWFAVRTRHQHEKGVSAALRGKGYEELLPLYEIRRRHHGSLRRVQFPLFPGYVFCQFDVEFRLPVLTIPGVVHVVGAGKSPVPIPDAEITAIQRIVQSGVPSQPWPFLELGHRVRIERGPLREMEGILLRFKNEHRLVVSVSMLQRSVAVEIDREWISPLAGSRRVPESVLHHFPVETEPVRSVNRTENGRVVGR